MQRVDPQSRRFPTQPDLAKPHNGLKENRSVIDTSNGNYHHQNGSAHTDGITGSLEDGALYTVDHLATFTVGESYELVYPKDGIARLRQMEKSSGIWTQRMYLKLERSSLVIIDYENGDIVERFPLDLVTDSSHFISHDPKDLYNNILLFTVKEDPRSKGNSISEMHLFHCLKTSAQKIAEDIQYSTRGISKGNSGIVQRSGIPPPPNKPPPDPPSNNGNTSGVNVRQRVDLFQEIIVNPSLGRQLSHQLEQEAENDNDSQRSTDNSNNYERDVAVLNHCFDDIERFIARLQYASASYKELERRRRQRKSKRKETGDGMLIARSKAPPEKSFVDIFQKFKYSFNLLVEVQIYEICQTLMTLKQGKLRSHIHDPNAPELIHFLFTPLALVVDASHEAHQGQHLAGNVVSPLLTKEAKQLLLNCLTSKESELWQSLGEAWTLSQQEWPGYVPMYIPSFNGGFNSDPGYSDGRPSRGAIMSLGREREYDGDFPDSSYSNSQRQKAPANASPYSQQYSEKDRQSEASDGPTLEQELNKKQRRFVAQLESQNAKIVQVMYSRASKNDKELSVQRGEILEITSDSRNWWQARNIRGNVGYVPNTIVAAYQSAHSPDDAYASYPPSNSYRNPHDRYSD